MIGDEIITLAYLPLVCKEYTVAIQQHWKVKTVFIYLVTSRNCRR